MCVPMTISPNTSGPQSPAPVDAEAIDNPERTSETADAVGRPDDQKKFPVIEDYWEARRRQRMLEMLRMQQAGPEGQSLNPALNPAGSDSLFYRSSRRRGGTSVGGGGAASKGG